jgi:hypothetical protein
LQLQAYVETRLSKIRERVVAADKLGDCGMSKGLTVKASKLIRNAMGYLNAKL